MGVDVEKINKKVAAARVNIRTIRSISRKMMNRILSELELQSIDKKALAYVVVVYLRRKGYEVDEKVVEEVIESVVNE